MKENKRLDSISEYHFKRIDELKERLASEGKKIFDFGIGDPDLGVDSCIVTAMHEATRITGFNKYPPYDGIKELKAGIIKYYKDILDVSISPDEVVVLIGSKEGLNNIIPAVCDIGDSCIVPTPSYPVYSTCARLWGVMPYNLVISEETDYLPQLEHIPQSVIDKSKLFIINYPNNPTGATADNCFFKEMKKFCIKNNIVLCNDAAYMEIIERDAEPVSILQGNTKENCIEFGTFSKTFNMTGFRIGYAVGDAKIIKALLKIKTNVDSGQFMPVQYAAVRALNSGRSGIIANRSIYDERRNILEEILLNKHIGYFQPGGTFYIWCRVPEGFKTDEFCEELIKKYGIIVTPGYTFGREGEGYFRISLTKGSNVIREAFDRIEVYN